MSSIAPSFHSLLPVSFRSMSLERILYIEDEDDIRMVVSMILKTHGITVNGHACSQQAIDSAAQSVPDLILLDISMPHKDGFQTLAELRQLPGYRNVPAVFMTAQLEPNAETLAPYQPVAVIMKPFEPSGLKEELESILNTMNINNPGT